MSLLIGARGQNFVVVLADGISIRIKDDKPVTEKLDQPKVFPISDHPCLLAHHGLNEVGQLRIEKLLTNSTFQKLQARSWSKGLNVAIARTINHLDTSVSQTMKSFKQRTVFGLWYAGYWPCTHNPEITELVWHESEPKRVRVAVKPHGPIVMGGGGFKFIRDHLDPKSDSFINTKKIYTEPVEYSMELVKKLYDTALKRQKEEGKTPIFGGTRQMAVITKDGVDYGPLD